MSKKTDEIIDHYIDSLERKIMHYENQERIFVSIVDQLADRNIYINSESKLYYQKESGDWLAHFHLEEINDEIDKFLWSHALKNCDKGEATEEVTEIAAMKINKGEKK